MNPTRAALIALLVLAGSVPLPPRAQVVDGSRKSLSQIQIGSAKAQAGATLGIPISVRDGLGSPLGIEREAGASVQSIALRVRVLPATAVVDARVERAGITASATPRFEVSPRTVDGVSWLAVFDDPVAPLLLPPRTTSTVAMLQLTLASTVRPGDRIELRLDPAVSVLANGAGTVQESVANGWVTLRDGLITVR